MMKNTFYFIFSFFRYLHFYSDFLVKWKKELKNKVRLTSRFMKSQTGQQIITIPVLPNIPRSNGNQTKKFIVYSL